ASGPSDASAWMLRPASPSPPTWPSTGISVAFGAGDPAALDLVRGRGGAFGIAGRQAHLFDGGPVPAAQRPDLRAQRERALGQGARERAGGFVVARLAARGAGALAQVLDHRVAQRHHRQFAIATAGGGLDRGQHLPGRGVGQRLGPRRRGGTAGAGGQQQDQERGGETDGRRHHCSGSGVGGAGGAGGSGVAGGGWRRRRPKQSRQPRSRAWGAARSGVVPSGSRTSGSGAMNEAQEEYGGAKPATKAKRRAPGHSASVALDCSTHCQSSPWLPTRSVALGRRENRPDHTRIAPVAPYSPVCSFWSLPTQATARWSPVQPANQLSRPSLLVPVLPAALRRPSPSFTSWRPVPELTACCSARVTRRAAIASPSVAGAGSLS